MSEPFAHTSGPRDAPVIIVGEAWGEQEANYLPSPQPFVGESGKELFRMLFDAWMADPEWEKLVLSAMRDYGHGWVSTRNKWLAKQGILLTNVFAERPQSNNLLHFCSKKSELGPDYLLPPVKTGAYIRPEYLHHLDRLARELTAYPRTCILACGNTATWALLHSTKISSIRGYVSESVFPPGLKVLPTFHPANVLYNFEQRPVVLADLMKLSLERQSAEISRPSRQIFVNPTLAEFREFVFRTLAAPPPSLGADIETALKQITCISFAPSKDFSFVVPIWDSSRPGWSYWSAEEEIEVWKLIKLLLESEIPKVGQNFIYDLQYLWRHGVFPKNCQHDTMLLHHAAYPELPKGLGFLGSIYTNEQSWKLLRLAQKQTETKANE